jgi:putative addiction module component (TIGR02574 family)
LADSDHGEYERFMKLADFPEVRELPVRDKLQLVDDLWLSVEAELSSLDVSNEEKALLEERWAPFLKAPDSALTLEQFQEKMSVLRG